MPLAGSAAQQPGQTDLLSMMGSGQAGGASSPDAGRQQIEEQIAKIRELDQLAQAIGASMPSLSQEVQQVRTAIKRMVMKAGQTMPASTGSAEAVPMGG